jgi:hypothetical protein
LTDIADPKFVADRLLDGLNARLQLIDLTHHQLDTATNCVGKFSPAGALCESVEFRNAPKRPSAQSNRTR